MCTIVDPAFRIAGCVWQRLRLPPKTAPHLAGLSLQQLKPRLMSLQAASCRDKAQSKHSTSPSQCWSLTEAYSLVMAVLAGPCR